MIANQGRRVVTRYKGAMKRRTPLIVLSLGCAAVVLAAAPRPQRLPAMTAPAWIEDIDFFARELPKRHLDAFHTISRERFEAAVADTREKAKSGKAGDDEMIVGLMHAASLVGDAPTRIQLPAGMHRLPIVIALFDKEYRVTRATPEAKVLLGGRIVKIQDTEIADVERKLRRIIAQDESEAYVRGEFPLRMSVAQLLHGLQIIPDTKKARVTVALPAGEKTLELWSIPAGINPKDWPSVTAETPLFRQNAEEALSFTYLEASKTVYANFRTYDALPARAKALWTLVDEKAPSKIVFDLRQNGGGDPKLGRKHLVEELEKREKLKTYVLVGNRTFDGAMNNALEFKSEARATLVGEPIGEKPNSYQEPGDMVLPKSRLVVSYATKYEELLPKGSPSTVTPDKVVVPTWDDFVAGRDPVLDWVLKQ